MIGQRGRHGALVLIDGDMMEVRSLVRTGQSRAITLPKLWLELVEQKGKLKGVGVVANGEMLIVRPYYGEGVA